MHGTIIQLEEKPLRFEEDFACEEDFYDDFVGVIADYVSDDVDRDVEIQYFIEYLKKYKEVTYDPQEYSIIFPKGFKEEYFSARFFNLKKIVQELTLEEFSTDSTKVWILENLIEEKYGIYIYHKETWTTFDEFVRYNLKEGQKYYIGTVLDYHF
ncbi:hypothetical protein VTU32_08200 [Thermoanaerobacter sp. CM-CNRG TB177]|jgi:hypothetical protein|uniref:hypothetical protein n=1 Tax=Thermoanaerobacter sp. CM-CNRG TB177 TaxID=2800659 RepID=UPI001BDEAFE0|nr:hypothetical protein [Thermoanaerobacter sp. CM-CNRG TB177]MBT1280253.1 hypothetical protein [Thermoanaerobacter sp. CM-CNRG TB177]MDI3500977.1 hypothetical protein [Thermoanaerobacter sp.]